MTPLTRKSAFARSSASLKSSERTKSARAVLNKVHVALPRKIREGLSMEARTRSSEGKSEISVSLSREVRNQCELIEGILCAIARRKIHMSSLFWLKITKGLVNVQDPRKNSSRLRSTDWRWWVLFVQRDWKIDLLISAEEALIPSWIRKCRDLTWFVNAYIHGLGSLSFYW